MYFSKKSTVALAVAATFAGGAMTAAYASSVSDTYSTYATESAIAGNLKNVPSPGLAYQPTNPTIAGGTTFTIYVKLNGGATWSTAPATTAVNYGGNTPATSVTLGPNNKVAAFQFTAPSGGFTNADQFNLVQGKSGSGKINLQNATALNNSGGVIKADFALVNGAVTSPVSYPSNPIDTATGTAAKSKSGISIVPVSSSNFTGNSVITSTKYVKNGGLNNGYATQSNESAKISVTSTPPLTALTSYGLAYKNNSVDLGAVYLKQTSGTQLNGSNNDYNVNNNVGQVKVTVSGNFLTNGQEQVSLYSKPDCSGTPFAGPKTPSSSSSVTLTANFSSAASGSFANYPVYGCITVGKPNSGSSKVQLPTTHPKITSLSVYDASNSTVVDSLSSPFSLYNLQYNGSSVNLINYVPAAAAPYMTYVRVANNGSVSAPVTAVLKSSNGNTLASGKLGSLASGASQTYSAKQIENDLGVSPAANNRLQIQLTAPTNKLKAQSYLGNGNGGFTNMTSDKG